MRLLPGLQACRAVRPFGFQAWQHDDNTTTTRRQLNDKQRNDKQRQTTTEGASMALTQTGPERGRYLVRAVNDAVPLTGFLDSIANDPGVTIITRIGPAGQPHTVVTEMSHDRARALEQQFNQSQQPIMIEPDRPLSMFDSTPDRKGL
jgi:hypothetical protein